MYDKLCIQDQIPIVFDIWHLFLKMVWMLVVALVLSYAAL